MDADVLDYYLHEAPSPQNTLDLFAGEWTSLFPEEYGDLKAGTVPLFGDDRLAWGMQQLGGVDGKTVLELGSLEGGHTSMFEVWGAASIVAIEAHSRAYLRSLIVKEILGLRRAQFLYGDCVKYLAGNPGTFDICCASGILYHMTDPVALLAAISRVCNGIYLWTHYYDRDIIANNPRLASRFNSNQDLEYDGFKYTLYRQDYGSELRSEKFVGGKQSHSQWMSRQAILDCLEHFGFGEMQINYDILDHPHGPSFSVTAVKTKNRVTPNSSSISHEQNNGQLDLTAQKITKRSPIEELTAQLQQSQDRIVAMESSKFWKLRTQWFKLKSLLGLPTD